MISIEEILKIKNRKTKKINSLIAKRFSRRIFFSKPMDKNYLEKIFEAGRGSAPSYNRQPWFFYGALQGNQIFEKLASILLEGNAWAKNAPFLILACYIKEDELVESKYAQYDLGQAVFSLVFRAQELGYYTHQIAGFGKKKAKKLLKLPENHKPWVLIALGKIGDYSRAEKSLVKKDYELSIRKAQVYKIFKKN